MNIEILMIAMKVLLFLCVGAMFGFLAKYMIDYKVVSLIVAKIRGDILEYDRVKRTQIRASLESSRSILDQDEKEKDTPISKLYRRIEMTGVSIKFPGFSETTFICMVVLVGIALFATLTICSSLLTGMLLLLAYLVAVWYCLGLITYMRKQNVESQLLQFTNSCASASRQYSSIIDIIGAVYDQFEGAFREALEACYVEAKTTNNQELAFMHLKGKFDSTQLAFIIDNFVMCSASTGDYYMTATDLSKTVSIYATSHEKKAITLRNAKIEVCVMFVIAGVIMYALGSFFESGLDVIFHTTIGNLLLIVMISIFLAGISIKAD